MPLTQQTLAQLQQLESTAYSAAATLPARTDAGSTLGSMFNAVALLGVQIQQQIAYTAAVARLATSAGADVDSFCSPFGVTRLVATASTGGVTFTTPSPVSSQVVVPNGTIVQTPSGLQFTVIADTTNAAYSVALTGYPIAAGGSSVVATVQCASIGSVGNVAAGQITQIFSGPGSVALSTSYTVTNANPFASGANAESDAALIARFTASVSGYKSGTRAAIAAAILGVQPGLTYAIGDQIDVTGAAKSAYFSVLVNVLGTSTAPPASLLTSVTNAVGLVRPAGISYAVAAPTLVPVNAVATIPIASGFTAATVIANCVTAYNTLVNGVGLDPNGVTKILSLGGVYAALYQVAGVSRVDSLTLNGATADISAAFPNQIVAGTSTFTAA